MGLSTSLTSLVWIAGPLSGVAIQPLMGVLSDRSRNSWGRRRPYILGGAIGTILSMIFLAWLEELMKTLTRFSYGDADDGRFGTVVIIFAAFGIYILNTSIQPLQMGLRTLVIENCPRSQQEQASAWTSRLTGVGNIIGYLAGITDLSRFAPSLFVTQFQGLCLVASVSLAIGVSMSCIAVTEKNPEEALLPTGDNSSFSSYFRQLLRTYRTMPWKIRRVCHIQFCAWMAWFPFLFYSTT
jgi:solute carrier family 45, member 1/2/4